jgi:hypothetical protein
VIAFTYWVPDQDKGIIPAMALELQHAFNFHCGRHRSQNITKRTSKKGISGTSATQEFERLVKANTILFYFLVVPDFFR